MKLNKNGHFCDCQCQHVSGRFARSRSESGTVFPSVYEGWGLPVGESFWFGRCTANLQLVRRHGRSLRTWEMVVTEMVTAIRSYVPADVSMPVGTDAGFVDGAMAAVDTGRKVTTHEP